MYVRCDNWCCLCLDVSNSSLISDHSMEENLIPNTSRHTTTTIRLKNPPKGSSVINHIQSQRRWHIDSSDDSEDYEEDTVEEWTE